MRDRLKALVEERANLWEETLKPLVVKDEMTAEEKDTFSNGEARLEELDEKIEQITSAIKRERDEEDAAVRRAELLSSVEGETVSPEEVVDADARYAEVFNKYLRRGFRKLNDEEIEVLEARQAESRALTTTTGSSGGFTIPTDFMQQIVSAQAQFGGIRNAPITVLSTGDGADIEVPTDDDTGQTGELISENTAATEQDVAFGQKVLKAWLWSSKLVKVPLTLIQDSAFDMQAFLAAKFGRRIGSAQATYLITGTGSSQPEGIVTNATVGHTTATAQTTTLIYDDFVELEHSVDPAYRANGHYILSDDALRAARLIKDQNDLPIWAPGMVGDFPNTINGFSYTVDVNMASVAASNKPVLFGDVSYYWLRDVIDFEFVRLDERYAESRQAGFLAWARMDARPVDAGDAPYKVLAMAAS